MYEKQVAKGAAWLDQAYPEWEDRIDLGQLDMGNTCSCILGQLLAPARLGYRIVRGWMVPAMGEDATQKWLEGHGFTLPGTPVSSALWGPLEETWVSLLKERRNA
jgi:hypothetical protein